MSSRNSDSSAALAAASAARTSNASGRATPAPDPFDRLAFLERRLKLGTWHRELETGHTVWSPGVYELFGLAQGDPPSRDRLETLLHPSDLHVLAEYDLALAAGLDFDGRYRIILPGGGVRWIRARSEIRFGRKGRPDRVVGVVQDATDEQDVALRLTMIKARYLALARASQAIVWTARHDFYVRELNDHGPTPRSALHLARFLGFEWRSMVHPDDLDATERAWQVARQEKRAGSCEHRVLQPDGSYRWARTRAAPLLDGANDLVGWEGLSEDIHNDRDWTATAAAHLLTGAQIRGARGILNLSVRDLAERATTTVAAVRSMERKGTSRNGEGPRLRSALEAAGIEFLFPADGEPGLRPAGRAK